MYRIIQDSTYPSPVGNGPGSYSTLQYILLYARYSVVRRVSQCGVPLSWILPGAAGKHPFAWVILRRYCGKRRALRHRSLSPLLVVGAIGPHLSQLLDRFSPAPADEPARTSPSASTSASNP